MLLVYLTDHLRPSLESRGGQLETFSNSLRGAEFEGFLYFNYFNNDNYTLCSSNMNTIIFLYQSLLVKTNMKLSQKKPCCALSTPSNYFLNKF